MLLKKGCPAIPAALFLPVPLVKNILSPRAMVSVCRLCKKKARPVPEEGRGWAGATGWGRKPNGTIGPSEQR